MLGLCCPTQILPPLPNPQLILLKAASEESKTVNTTPTAHASSAQTLLRFHTQEKRSGVMRNTGRKGLISKYAYVIPSPHPPMLEEK